MHIKDVRIGQRVYSKTESRAYIVTGIASTGTLELFHGVRGSSFHQCSEVEAVDSPPPVTEKPEKRFHTMNANSFNFTDLKEARDRAMSMAKKYATSAIILEAVEIAKIAPRPEPVLGPFSK